MLNVKTFYFSKQCCIIKRMYSKHPFILHTKTLTTLNGEIIPTSTSRIIIMLASPASKTSQHFDPSIYACQKFSGNIAIIHADTNKCHNQTSQYINEIYIILSMLTTSLCIQEKYKFSAQSEPNPSTQCHVSYLNEIQKKM